MKKLLGFIIAVAFACAAVYTTLNPNQHARLVTVDVKALPFIGGR